MMGKRILVLVLFIYFTGVFYLVLPEPSIPGLPGAFRSTEPGDTGQNPRIEAAYYTNWQRKEVIDFYAQKFGRSPTLNFPLMQYRLNHPPEYARETIIDTLQTNFYEELVHPLRESLFISGWIPKEDKVYLSQSKEPVTEFLINGQYYQAKITLHYVRSAVWARLVIWTGIMVVGMALTQIFRSLISTHE